jgi:phytoene/squalene synthetase
MTGLWFQRLSSRPPDRLPYHAYDAVAEASAALVIRSYSTSFGLATRLLTEPVRTHVRNIYALVRLADEIVDAPRPGATPDQVAALLDGLEAETRRALGDGHSANLVVHAFARSARACGIEMALLEPFFASMRTDLHRSSHDEASLAAYVYGSAEVVGLMCLHAFLQEPGATATYDELAPGARRLGAAFQRINFLRDLAADHTELGRLYFPDVDPTTLDDRVRDRLLLDIEADLDAAEAVIWRLPPSSRRAVGVAHGLFAELSQRLRRAPVARLQTERVRVPATAKARVVATSLARGAR